MIYFTQPGNMTDIWKMDLKLLTSLVVITCSSACMFPPSMWCSSDEIARQCQVLDQCEQYHNTPPAPIDVTFYFESLCPDCKRFISGQLWRAWNLVPSIMKLTLVPFGNARESKGIGKWKFTCQHGKEECVGNVIECSQHFKVDYDAITKCANSDMGNQLEHQMALKTMALNPPHKYVPWVTINGVHTEEMEKKVEDDLVKLLCDMYTGDKPPACSSYQSDNLLDNKYMKL
ncbi:hypothetical protein KUTeg_012883 [Tegillarca granosa]|uniref:Saposin A-type domain-containing protein n=1 Tax=Tegillarca granosa TaxID=220873 RepID=A0ABQ9ESJ5_TEGGR|nr:hypothetical protein KUTeg_012883 [Tegillarca granosa]